MKGERVLQKVNLEDAVKSVYQKAWMDPILTSYILEPSRDLGADKALEIADPCSKINSLPLFGLTKNTS